VRRLVAIAEGLLFGTAVGGALVQQGALAGALVTGLVIFAFAGRAYLEGGN
jgi:uncharacterized membrane protein YdjX (TVP38/TMEM64 family)